MSDFTNLSIVPPAVQGTPKNSNSNVQEKTKVASQSVTRTIAPLTKYNSETGNLDVDESSPWGGGASQATEEVATETAIAPTTTTTNERHEKWKTDQAAKKEARQASKAERAATQAVSLKEMFSKGDIVGAAAVLNMSPADLLVLTQNAALKIPTEQKELTPEQKKTQEEESFRSEYASFKKEQEQFKYQQIASSFIKDNIDPILSDKEKFEMINAPGNDVRQIKTVIYEYMNKHYQDTTVYDSNGNVIKDGQILSPADIAETIEQQLYDVAVQNAERLKLLKKTAKLLTPAEQAVIAEQAEEMAADEEPSARTRLGMRNVAAKSEPFKEPTVSNKTARPLDSRFPTRDPEADVDEEEELNETKDVPMAAVKRNGSTANTPFALLSREERLALMKAGK